MKINTHGYPMNGLEEASNATGGWPKNSGGYTQISYDMDTGDVMTDDHADQNSADPIPRRSRQQRRRLDGAAPRPKRALASLLDRLQE